MPKNTVTEEKRLKFFCFLWILFSREWIHVGHWSCSLLARLSTWIYVIWTRPRQPLKDISLSESEERLDCSPKWASSVGGSWGWGRVLHPLDWARTLGFKFQSYALLLTHADLLQSLSRCRCGHVPCARVRATRYDNGLTWSNLLGDSSALSVSKSCATLSYGEYFFPSIS